MKAHRSPGFFRAAARAAAPLLLWALHFFASYALVAASCLRGWAPWPVRVGLVAFTLGVAALLLAWLVAGLRQRRHGERSFAEDLRTGAALLALVGVMGTLPPLAALPVCEPPAAGYRGAPPEGASPTGFGRPRARGDPIRASGLTEALVFRRSAACAPAPAWWRR